MTVKDQLELIELESPKIACPQDAEALLRRYEKDPNREYLYVIHLTPAMRAKSVLVAARGASQSLCFDVGDILCEAISSKSKAIIIAHNHPHEEAVWPSATDITTTSDLHYVCTKARIPLVDHLILGPKEFHSMATQGHRIFQKDSYILLDREIESHSMRHGKKGKLSSNRKYQSDFILDCRRAP